jgi:hypothetical protein
VVVFPIVFERDFGHKVEASITDKLGEFAYVYEEL